MHTACTCPCSTWMSCFLAGVQICESLFLLLSWDTAYLFPLSCSLPRSSATILIPTSLGVSLAKHVHTLGDQPDGMGGLPPYLEWQLNVDSPTLCDFQHHIPYSILSTPTTPLLHTACYDPGPLPPIFQLFYFALSVTRPSLVPSRAARTATKSPDKSPDRLHD